MRWLLRKRCFAAAVVLGCSLFAALSTVSAQTALFTYDDGNGTPNAGTYSPGDSFTFSVTLDFTPGGSVSNLEGLSYWFQQQTASPFIFSITSRDVTGSQFTVLQTPGLTYPQMLNPTNPNDLGAYLPSEQPADGMGTYLIANITVSISPLAPIAGTYVLRNSISGGTTSVISDSLGHTFAIPEADYTVTMVPEPATWAGAALLSVFLLVRPFRRHKARA
jgi:hypothetical protein